VPDAMQGTKTMKPREAADTVRQVPQRMPHRTVPPTRRPTILIATLVEVRCARCVRESICMSRHPKRDLYDQSVDPRALHNLATSAKAVADAMAEQLEEFDHKTSSVNTEQANLTALGYATSDIIVIPWRAVGWEKDNPQQEIKKRIFTADLIRHVGSRGQCAAQVLGELLNALEFFDCVLGQKAMIDALDVGLE